MTKKQKLLLEQSEKREKINALLDKDELTDEERGELDSLTKRMQQIEPELRAAIVAQDEDEERARRLFDVDDGDVDAETAELRALRGRVRLGNYVHAAVEERDAAGAEAEYNEARGLAGNRFPLELLAPAVEERATTNAEAATRQSRWLDRLFSSTAAMRLGITFESVNPGVSAHPVTTAGASAAQRGRTQAADDASWTVGVTEIKPTRNAVRAKFSEEDAARLPRLEEALRRDLSMALTEGVDRAIFLGDAGANEDTADITGLTGLTASATGFTEVTLSQANKVKAPETLAVFAGLVDGKHAASLGDLNVIASVGANTLWLSSIANASADTKTVASFLRENGLGWGIRGDIEAATAAGDFGAFIGRARGIGGAGVAAVWSSGTMIRDPYSGAAKGEVALTLSHLWGLAFPRPSSFARLKFVS